MKFNPGLGSDRQAVDYSLYLVTDSALMSSATIEESVALAIAGGCTVVQLREKNISSLDFYEKAMAVKKITSQHRVPLIINDRVDIALAVDAEGVHIGQEDLPAAAVRKIIGPDKILGVSVANQEQTRKALSEGADYLGAGAMFYTNTKTDAKLVTIEELKQITKLSPVPVVAIGGMSEKTIPLLKGTGIAGAAVVSAIVASPDVTQAAKKLAACIRRELL